MLEPEPVNVSGKIQARHTLARLYPREIDRGVLGERRRQPGGALFGGSSRCSLWAAPSWPRMLVMDEPSMGLSPLYVDQIFDIIQGLNRDGIGILLVEQNANMALSIAARGYVLQSGRIVLHDMDVELRGDVLQIVGGANIVLTVEEPVHGLTGVLTSSPCGFKRSA